MDLTEILKDVPQGIKLQCLLFKDPVTLYSVTPSAPYPISVKTSVGERIFLSKEGYYSSVTASQNCMLYPPMMSSWDNVEYVPDGKLVVCERDGKIIQIGCAKGGFARSQINVYWWYDLEAHKLEVDSPFYFDRQATEYRDICNLLGKEGYKMAGTELKQIYEFKRGDIIVDRIGIIAIFDHADFSNAIVYKAIRRTSGQIVVKTDTGIGYIYECRLATEVEKNLFFNSLAEAGYAWDGKEVIPVFKKGDIIISDGGCLAIVDHIGKFGSHSDVVYYQACYNTTLGMKVGTDLGIGRVSDCRIAIESDKLYFLKVLGQMGYIVKDGTVCKEKFNPETFEPFQKVLVRATSTSNWRCTFFSHMGDSKAICSGDNWSYCIPYENNEHLRGKANDCDDFYKWWKLSKDQNYIKKL